MKQSYNSAEKALIEELKNHEYVGPFSLFVEEALEDLVLFANRDNCQVDFDWWVSKDSGKQCACLGGAAILGFLPPHKSKLVEEFNPMPFKRLKLCRAFEGLDYFRLRWWSDLCPEFINEDCLRELNNSYIESSCCRPSKTQLNKFITESQRAIAVMRQHDC